MLHLSPKYDDDHFVKHRHHCNCNLFSVGTTFEERDKKWNSKLFRNCKGATFGLFIFYFWSIWNGCDDTPPGIELDYLLAILLLSNFLCCPPLQVGLPRDSYNMSPHNALQCTEGALSIGLTEKLLHCYALLALTHTVHTARVENVAVQPPHRRM